MLFLNDQVYVSEQPMRSKRELAACCHWNMWRRRKMPFTELEDGMPVF